MNQEPAFRTPLGQLISFGRRRVRAARATTIETALAIGDRTHGPPAYSQPPGDLALRQLPFIQQPIDFVDDR
jgi:hypothetical protein